LDTAGTRRAFNTCNAGLTDRTCAASCPSWTFDAGGTGNAAGTGLTLQAGGTLRPSNPLNTCGTGQTNGTCFTCWTCEASSTNCTSGALYTLWTGLTDRSGRADGASAAGGANAANTAGYALRTCGPSCTDRTFRPRHPNLNNRSLGDQQLDHISGGLNNLDLSLLGCDVDVQV
jgi:hypothetical protein